MKKPHYLIVSKFWRKNVPYIHDENHNQMPLQADLVENAKKFEHKNLLEARKQAFMHYNSILEVLYEGLQETQTTDMQARVDMQHYLDSGNGIILGNSHSKFKMNSMDMHNQIKIYFVIEDKKTPIHGVHYLDHFEINLNPFDDEIIEELENLISEYHYYKTHKIDTKGFTQCIEHPKLQQQTLIKTPVKWENIKNYVTIKSVR